MLTPGPSPRRPGGSSRRSLPLLIVLVLVLAAGACFSSRSGEGGASAFADRPVTVTVENHNWNTVHVYVLAGGQYKSLGQISTQSSDTYELSADIMGSRKQIRLAADPIGSSEAFISDPILVEPGDVVSWTITQPLAHSRVFID